jgi:hypothetical protein
MCLFLDEQEQQEAVDWRRLMDFDQISLVFVILYVYFSKLSAEGSSLATYPLSAVTDGLLTGGFFLRALSLKNDPARKLFFGIGAFRFVSFLTDIYFVLGLPGYLNGSGFDLVWSFP